MSRRPPPDGRLHRRLGALVALALLAPLPTTGASNAFAEEGAAPILAIVDTGIRATHQEFDYRGPASEDDQLVAWWDFSAERAPLHLPLPGQTWDPLVPEPYDTHGHGTSVASVAVGLGADASKAPSHCPGCRLAVAKVARANGGIAPIDVEHAIRWAVEDVGADVVSISIGFSFSGTGVAPGILVALDEAIANAREAGVLVVVSAGNGHQNRGLPGHFSWFQGLGHSPHVLAVGGSSVHGGTADTALFSHDPEVVAHAITVRAASALADDAYLTTSGSSLAAPAVAGMALRLLRTADANGCEATPDRLEELLKRSARDTLLPPTLEGYGHLGAPQLQAALHHAAACTLPVRAETDPAVLHDRHVAATARATMADTTDYEGLTRWERTPLAPRTPLGVLDATGPGGLVELEAWTVRLAAGQRLEVHAAAADASALQSARDFNVGLFRPGALDDGVLEGHERLRLSEGPVWGAPETLTHRAVAAGDYVLVVMPYTTALPVPYRLDAQVDGHPVMWTGAEQFVAAGVSVY